VQSIDVDAIPVEQELGAIEDTPAELQLWNDPPPGATLAHEIVQQPEHGTLSGTGHSLVYTPNANYSGPDLIKYAIGVVGLPDPVAEVLVNIVVAPENDPPVASDIAASAIEGVPVLVTLSAEDMDDVDLTFEVVRGPEHGTLHGQPPYLQYEPSAGFFGEDSFAYVAVDATAESNSATVQIMVMAASEAIPRIAPAVGEKGELVLAWRALPGRVYRVQFKPTLSEAEWTRLGNATLTSGDTLTWPVDVESASGFYAVELVLP
jgi:hypothetical protein